MKQSRPALYEYPRAHSQLSCTLGLARQWLWSKTRIGRGQVLGMSCLGLGNGHQFGEFGNDQVPIDGIWAHQTSFS